MIIFISNIGIKYDFRRISGTSKRVNLGMAYYIVSERKVRVLNKIKAKTTRPETIAPKRHPSSPSATPRQAKAQRQKVLSCVAAGEEGRRETHKGTSLRLWLRRGMDS